MYSIGQEEIDAVARVINSKELFRINENNREVDNFERELEKKIGSKYGLCLSGGTGALISALVGLGVGPGDEVIVPGYTFMATATAVLAVGAIPVIVDVDDSLTIDPEDIERKLSSHTKAIIPVHIVGFPCDMEKIMAIAKKHNLKVVEDACQADGGSYKGKRLGSWGDAGVFSFNFFKIITAGEGGAIVTDDETVYERALIYHDGGAAFRPYANELKTDVFIGSQHRASEITGAIMRVQLSKLDEILEILRKMKKRFIDELSNVPNVVFARSNDSEGDCGTTLSISFPDEKKARKFACSEGVEGILPIDSGRHVYTNWDPVMNKRGAHHPVLNPYLLKENKDLNMNYSADMCQRTLDILSRNVYIPMRADWSDEQINKKIESCRKALL